MSVLFLLASSCLAGGITLVVIAAYPALLPQAHPIAPLICTQVTNNRLTESPASFSLSQSGEGRHPLRTEHSSSGSEADGRTPLPDDMEQAYLTVSGVQLRVPAAMAMLSDDGADEGASEHDESLQLQAEAAFILQQQVGSAVRNADSLRAQLDNALKQLESTQGEMLAVQELVEQREEELAATRKQLAEASQQAEEIAAEAVQQGKQLEKARAELQMTHAELDATSALLVKATQQSNLTQQDREGVKLGQLEVDQNNLQARITQLEAKLAAALADGAKYVLLLDGMHRDALEQEQQVRWQAQRQCFTAVVH